MWTRAGIVAHPPRPAPPLRPLRRAGACSVTDAVAEGANMPASRTRGELLGQLLESAFRGRTAHSLLANLSGVRDADWDVRPPGGDRSIGEIVEHCAIAAELRHDTLLGGEQRTYAAILTERRRAGVAGPAALREALIAAHDRFLASMRSLDDAQLRDAVARTTARRRRSAARSRCSSSTRSSMPERSACCAAASKRTPSRPSRLRPPSSYRDPTSNL